jgi:hypothetical protein
VPHTVCARGYGLLTATATQCSMCPINTFSTGGNSTVPKPICQLCPLDNTNTAPGSANCTGDCCRSSASQLTCLVNLEQVLHCTGIGGRLSHQRTCWAHAYAERKQPGPHLANHGACASNTLASKDDPMEHMHYQPELRLWQPCAWSMVVLQSVTFAIAIGFSFSVVATQMPPLQPF